MDLVFPNHQINQSGDEAHGDEREGDHQPVRRIHKQELVLGAVLEVLQVDLEEEVLDVGVRVIAADYVRQILQAHRHVVVRSVADREISVLMMIFSIYQANINRHSVSSLYKVRICCFSLFYNTVS